MKTSAEYLHIRRPTPVARSPWEKRRKASQDSAVVPERKAGSNVPNPLITTGETSSGARPRSLRTIRLHAEGAGCRGEAAPRPYFFVAYPHVIDGLGNVSSADLQVGTQSADLKVSATTLAGMTCVPRAWVAHQSEALRFSGMRKPPWCRSGLHLPWQYENAYRKGGRPGLRDQTETMWRCAWGSLKSDY